MTNSKLTDPAKLSRREATQNALMRSVESLAAERGLENISIREILARAGQKNESALQYHFKNLSGLLNALRTTRSQEIAAHRAKYLHDLLFTDISFLYALYLIHHPLTNNLNYFL